MKKSKLLSRVLVIAGSVVAAFAITACILAVLGADVLKTFSVIFLYPFSSVKMLSGVINILTPLAIVGIGICVAYRSGFTNIGGEGQMTAGLLLSIIVALKAENWPRAAAIPAVLLAGMIGGGLWGAIAGILKTRFRVSELLSTVMLNYTATQIYNYCLRVPLLDKEVLAGGGDIQTEKLPKTVWLSRMNELIPGLEKNVRFHTGILFAVVLAVIVFLFMWKTVPGYKMRAAGASARASRYGGINVDKYVVLSVVISGMCCGLAGAIEALGIHHRGVAGITGGYGFSGIVVALFGGLHPLGVLPAAFFFAVISYGCSSLQINKIPLPSNTIDMLLGLVILVVVSAKSILGNRYTMDRLDRRLFARRSAEGGKGNA